MTATNKKILEQEPGEIEALLPWHAAGTLSARDSRRVEDALARDSELAKQYAVIRKNTPRPSRSMRASARRPRARCISCLRRSTPNCAQAVGVAQDLHGNRGNFSRACRRARWLIRRHSARWPLLLQAGVIGAFLASSRPGRFKPRRLSGREGNRRPFARAETAPRALVRFAPDARIADITAFLDANQASIIDSSQGGMFRLQFGDKPMSRQETASLMTRLQSEKIINLAVTAQ